VAARVTPPQRQPELVRAALGDQAGLLGAALLAWRQARTAKHPNLNQVAISSRAPGGAFTPARVLAGVNRDPGEPTVAANDRGDAVVVWSQLMGRREEFTVWAAFRGPGTGFSTAAASSLTGELSHLAPVLLPIKLAGQHVRIIPDLLPIGIYGRGLSTFAVLALSGSAGERLLSGARTAGGTPISTANGTGVAVSSPLVSVVLMHRDTPARPHFDETYLLAGLATRQTLEQAAATLVSRPGEAF